MSPSKRVSLRTRLKPNGVLALFIVASCLVWVGVGATSCASAPDAASQKPLSKTPPILFVHGIANDHTQWSGAVERMLTEGTLHLRAMDYVPNDGSVSIVELSKQVDAEATALLEKSGAEKIDVVGMSLGTQVLRYWMLNDGGLAKVRRFVGVAGPFSGTTWAHLGLGPVHDELTPNSPFLQDLEAKSLKPVPVTVICTPYDGVIVPASSCVFDKADHKISIPVISHPRMPFDERVHDAIVKTLAAPSP